MIEPRSAATARWKRWAFRARTLALLYFVVLAVATHIPAAHVAPLEMSDKWLHFSGYGLLTVLVLAGWELTVGVLEPKHYFAVWLVGTVYGAIDERTQLLVNRSCDVNDWLADAMGIVAGLLVFRLGSAVLYRVLAAGSLPAGKP